MTDIEIANAIKKKDIVDVAKEIGIKKDNLILYGNDKAKIINPRKEVELTNTLAKYLYKLRKDKGMTYDMARKLLIEDNTGIIYRKEQFTPENSLPCELIVRDRRYTLEEIKQLLEYCGFEIVESSFFQAGRMNTQLSANDRHAKEILIIAKKVKFSWALFLKKLLHK